MRQSELHDLFISYCHQDGKSVADKVRRQIERQFGINAFLDIRRNPRSLQLSDDLIDALRNSRRLLLVHTQGATKSDWVRAEVSLALQEGKDIIILKLADDDPSKIHMRLAGLRVFSEKGLYSYLESLEWGIEVIVPAAGESVGLTPFNLGMPKILLPIDEKPILHHIIGTLNTARTRPFSRIRILCGKFEPMIRYYAGLVDSSIPVECDNSVHETLPLALGSALTSSNQKRTFLLYSSDIVLRGKVRWDSFIEQHRNAKELHGVIGTLMASDRHRLVLGRITPHKHVPQLVGKFEEKPENTARHAMNMAVSLFEPGIVKYLKNNDTSFFGQAIPRAIKQRQRFAFYGHREWLHIQTINDWRTAQEQWLAKGPQL